MNREEFMKTKEGKSWFRSKTKEMTKGSRSQLKRWIMNRKLSKLAEKKKKWHGEIDDAMKEQEKNNESS